MAQSPENQPENQPENEPESQAQAEAGNQAGGHVESPVAGHGAEEPAGPAGPDLSSLSEAGSALLSDFLDVLKDFEPVPGALNGLPQATIGRQHAQRACQLIKDDPRTAAKMLLCMACVDYSERFQMVYVLQSLEPERTLVLKTDLPYDDPTLPSVASVWRAADWYEREAHDLFGVYFEGHPDLKPLLLYEGFEGYPGRKEYPFYEYQEF